MWSDTAVMFQTWNWKAAARREDVGERESRRPRPKRQAKAPLKQTTK